MVKAYFRALVGTQHTDPDTLVELLRSGGYIQGESHVQRSITSPLHFDGNPYNAIDVKIVSGIISTDEIDDLASEHGYGIEIRDF